MTAVIEPRQVYFIARSAIRVLRLPLSAIVTSQRFALAVRSHAETASGAPRETMIRDRHDLADYPARIATWFGFVLMCLGMFMAILDIQVVATSLPTIQDALAISPDAMSWIQTAYLIAEVISHSADRLADARADAALAVRDRHLRVHR